jgi:predicted nucleic acid-binding protein
VGLLDDLGVGDRGVSDAGIGALGAGGFGVGPIGVDTSIFIYFIEDEPRYVPIVAPLFAAADRGRCVLVTSSLTLTEVIVVPFRSGHAALVERYEALLTRGRGIRLIDLTRDHFRAAAQLRAASGLRTPDALQLAAVRDAGCAIFLTNDRRLAPVPGLSVLQLGDYAG